jgi:hypothetical protein
VKRTSKPRRGDARTSHAAAHNLKARVATYGAPVASLQLPRASAAAGPPDCAAFAQAGVTRLGSFAPPALRASNSCRAETTPGHPSTPYSSEFSGNGNGLGPTRAKSPFSKWIFFTALNGRLKSSLTPFGIWPAGSYARYSAQLPPLPHAEA